MTTPISRDDLEALIRTHRDTLWTHRWNMTSAAIDTVTQTIKALDHYADLLDVIDGIEPHADPPEPEPSLPPQATAGQPHGAA